MKNCELAELGFCDRAMPTVPRSNGMSENSACRSGSDEPPMPALARLEAVFHVGELHVAGLGHEALDHPVKGDIVIFAGVGERLETGRMLAAPRLRPDQ